MASIRLPASKQELSCRIVVPLVMKCAPFSGCCQEIRNRERKVTAGGGLSRERGCAAHGSGPVHAVSVRRERNGGRHDLEDIGISARLETAFWEASDLGSVRLVGNPEVVEGCAVIHPQECLRVSRISTLLSRPDFRERLTNMQDARNKRIALEVVATLSVIGSFMSPRPGTAQSANGTSSQPVRR